MTTCFDAHHRELDLRDFVVNENNLDTLYELYAVTNHYGGLGGGHCKWKNMCEEHTHTHTHTHTLFPTTHTSSTTDTAFALNYENGKWYNFDDSHVTETDSSHVVVSTGTRVPI